MNATELAGDIPRSLAYQAHSGTSFVPDKRASQEVDGYAQQLASDYQSFAELAEKNGTQHLLEEQFTRYREGYKRRYLAYLSSRGRMVSTMIAGPSNFPARRMEKINGTVRNRSDDLAKYRERAQNAIRRTLCPTAGPIMAGAADAVERLQAELREREQRQEHMKATNAAIRKHISSGGTDAVIAALVERGIGQALATELAASHGFQHYELSNNNANIRRMKQRLSQIIAAKAAPEVEAEGEHAKFEDSPADNRVRLFFPGKPAADIRQRLKSNGFRWAPSLGCWQAYRNCRSIETAKAVAGIMEAVA